jgi:hypothetical protein
MVMATEDAPPVAERVGSTRAVAIRAHPAARPVAAAVLGVARDFPPGGNGRTTGHLPYADETETARSLGIGGRL